MGQKDKNLRLTLKFIIHYDYMFFTASGNSLYVAQRIGGKLLSIPQLMRQDKIEIEDDAVGIVCPVYVAELPMMVTSTSI